MTRTVFLGTPAAAVPTLQALAQSCDVALVVSQPDRPKGRSGQPRPSAIANKAAELGLVVAKPESRSALQDALTAVAPLDLGVVVAFGQILGPEVLSLPSRGFLNVHFSLLPRWRGAAPVARAIEAGDTMSGVTIIELDEGLDTGPVLTAQAIDIDPDETAGALTERLAHLGASLVGQVIPAYMSGEAVPVDQVEEGATYAEKVTSEDRPLKTTGEPSDFVNKVRALAPSPGATLELDGERHKILQARVLDQTVEPGSWAAIDGRPVVGVDAGGVALLRLQPPGKNVMEGSAWLRGRRVTQGRVS